MDAMTPEAREAATRIAASTEASLATQRQQVVTSLRAEIGTLATITPSQRLQLRREDSR